MEKIRIIVKQIKPNDSVAWDAYVLSHPNATLYHLSGWKNIIKKTYAHKTYYLIAIDSSKLKAQSSSNPSNPTNPTNPVIGILPLVHIKHFLFGNSLISIPFFDLGGILADNDEVEKALLTEAVQLAQKLKAKNIELRHTQPLSCLRELNPTNPITIVTKSHKVRMLLDLPESSEELMKSFKSKLRSQIKKPVKEGLKSKIGGLELIDDFYEVFLINMRNLGSPVHSKKLIQNVIEEFPEKTKIVIVYKEAQPIACSLVVSFKDTLENPWASALRKYSRLSPNMLLYWTMQKYACDNGFKYFDFGRSTPEEGTYKFKKQWSAKPFPLHWQYISLNGKSIEKETPEKSKFDKAIKFWQKLPVPVTKILGPMIRKYIGL